MFFRQILFINKKNERGRNMKFSRYRGKDIREMVLGIAVLVIAIAAVLSFGAYLTYKYVGPKMEKYSAVWEENRSKKEEEQKERQEKMQGYNEEEEQPDEVKEEKKALDGEEENSAGSSEPEKETDDTGIHRYEYIVEDCSWSEAADRCRGRGGYLANINSQEEYDYITGEIENNQLEKIVFYLGASRGAGSEYYWLGAEGEYYGEPLNGDSRWLQGEPSYQDGEIEENVLAIFYYDDEGRWVWNDIPNNILEGFSYYSGKIGYVCEYEE